MNKLMDVLKTLSDETRLRIINLLYERELCVCDVMGILQIAQAKASRHLIYLKNAGLVKDCKEAQWMHYSMNRSEQLKFLDSLVYDNLRTMELYQKDIENMHEWFKQKNQCDS
ncbi:ArsR/SmtB family transcription factor [Pectinatus frisingensis]|uniref:ArsR/SmtB family transcription factor n=1 Tax=Pectinatus frisingensis TaxID=865 RepID=UPI0018C5CB41|nr:metalloregulator ArsR/SmtB family transcription factor [Pectinatus frisingensis]